MARCERCFGCTSQWDFNNCQWCNYPGHDVRTEKQKEDDEKYIKDFEEEQYNLHL